MSKQKQNGWTTGKVAAVVIAIIFLGSWFGGFLAQWGLPSPFTTGGPGPEAGPGGPASQNTALVTTDVAAWNTLDISTVKTIGTDINALWYRYDGGWIQLASGDAQDLSVPSADNNVVYLALEYPGTPTWYVDYEKTLSMNRHLSWYGYQDITGDDVEEYIFKVDISDSAYASATGKWNMPIVNSYLLEYDASFAYPTAGQPADIASIGTSETTKYLKWYTEVSAEKKGIAVYKVVLKVNTTDISKVSLSKMNVPGVGYLDGSSFVQDVLSDQIKWTYTISNNVLYGAKFIKRPKNDPNEFKFTTAIKFNLATSDVLEFTHTIYELSAAEASVSDSDPVICKEGA